MCFIVVCTSKAVGEGGLSGTDAAGPAASSFANISADQLRFRQLSLKLQSQLRRSEKEFISTREFFNVAGGVGLTARESERALTLLDRSGGLVLQDGVVCLRPWVIYNRVHDEAGVERYDPCPEVTAKIAALEDELKPMEEAKDRADKLIARSRGRLWSVMAAASAAQMCFFSFLTFPSLSGNTAFYLGWDVIEPISYFVTQAYILIWFAYFFMQGREYNIERWDADLITDLMEKQYKKWNFDITRYATLKAELAALQQQREDALAKL